MDGGVVGGQRASAEGRGTRICRRPKLRRQHLPPDSQPASRKETTTIPHTKANSPMQSAAAAEEEDGLMSRQAAGDFLLDRRRSRNGQMTAGRWRTEKRRKTIIHHQHPLLEPTTSCGWPRTGGGGRAMETRPPGPLLAIVADRSWLWSASRWPTTPATTWICRQRFRQIHLNRIPVFCAQKIRQLESSSIGHRSIPILLSSDFSSIFVGGQFFNEPISNLSHNPPSLPQFVCCSFFFNVSRILVERLHRFFSCLCSAHCPPLLQWPIAYHPTQQQTLSLPCNSITTNAAFFSSPTIPCPLSLLFATLKARGN